MQQRYSDRISFLIIVIELLMLSMLPLPEKLLFHFIITDHTVYCTFPGGFRCFPSQYPLAAADNLNNSHLGDSLCVLGLRGLTEQHPMCMSKLFFSIWSSSQRSTGGTGQLQLAKLIYGVQKQPDPPPLMPCAVLDRFAQDNRAGVECTGSRERLLSVKGHAHKYRVCESVRERHRWMFFCGKPGWGWQGCLSLFLSLFISPPCISLSILVFLLWRICPFRTVWSSLSLFLPCPLRSRSFICQLAVWSDSKAAGSHFSPAPSCSWSSALWDLRAFKGVCPCMWL